MAKFTSKYPSFGFYAKGELKRFSNGIYATDDADEITVLTKLRDVEIVAEPKSAEPKPEAKPTPKPSPARKASSK